MAGFLNLRAVLGLNWSGFAVGLKQAESASASFSAKAKNYLAASFGTAAIVAYGNKVVEFVDRISDLSDTLDISTESLQKWARAARENGGKSLDDIQRFFEGIAVAREKAISGDAAAQADFWKFGINPADLKGMNLQSVAGGISNAISQSKNIQELIPALKSLGGKGATGLIPALKMGAEEINKLGVSISEEIVEQIKAAKSEAQALADSFMGPMARAIAYIAPKLRDAFSVFRIGAGGLAAFAGALSGGASIREAKDSAMRVMDEVLSEREKINAAISQKASTRTGYDSPIGPSEFYKIHPFATGAARSASAFNAPDLTSNQRAGALVRFDPNTSHLSNIDRNIGLLLQETKQQKEARQRRISAGGFGDAVEEWE